MINFQRRHYEFIARTIREMPSFAPSLRAQQESCASSFANALAGANPNFDSGKFLEACKPETTYKEKSHA